MASRDCHREVLCLYIMQVQGNLEQVLGAGRNRRQHRRQPAEPAAPAGTPANGSSVLADLLLKATDKRNQDLDAGVLRRIKALCKKSDEHIRAVHDYLLHALEANHAQVSSATQFSHLGWPADWPIWHQPGS